MQVDYTVHTVNTTQVPVTVEYNGQKIVAQVNCLEVELVPESTHNSAPILRFVGDDYEPARAKFTVGQKLVWSF